MNDYYKYRKYFVYRHVAPNDKMYVGITSKSDPKERWGNGGSGYSSNPHFWSAIKKYGWDNFNHIIVVHGVSVDTACHLEEYLIKKYDSMNNGYNQTSGGIYPTEVTDEIRNIISNKVRAYHNSLSAGEWSSKFIGHKMSDITRKKISAKHKGRKISEGVVARRVATFKANMTDERRKMYGDISRGRKVSDETRAKLSKVNKGRVLSSEAREKLRQKAIERISESRISNICKSKYKFIYTYDNLEFNTGEEVAAYLRNNGYPKIAQGTVNNICQGKTILAYPELSGKINRGEY